MRVFDLAHQPVAMPSRFFPPATRAAPEGLVFVGGQLTAERLLDGYRHGIFPWPAYPGEPMLWWSPDPRAILPLDEMYVSRRLLRSLNSGKFTVCANTAFGEVLEGCATGPGREHGTWLTADMIEAYTRLHNLGHAHSVETWHDGQLVGGVYGVAIGGLFSAESMFYRERDASKVALARLVEHLRARGYALLDVQQWTPHTGRLGVVDISRQDYLERLAEAVDLPVTFGEFKD
jgi:leucyl/phenylalanyl-tRNA--protein transferase